MDEKKVREAIELIRMEINILEGIENCGRVIEARKKKHIALYNIAIEALEKQLQKKVVDKSLVKDDGIAVGYVGKCPCCNEIIEDTTNVCDCGQRLGWSE